MIHSLGTIESLNHRKIESLKIQSSRQLAGESDIADAQTAIVDSEE